MPVLPPARPVPCPLGPRHLGPRGCGRPMTDEHAVTTDGEARRQAIAARGSVLVQAPAGSGKTTLLAQRYLRLLASVDAPERILALTFTRRAAEEMRARVIGALEAGGL